MNSDNIDFVTYCIGNLSRRLGLNARDVYHRLKTSGILADYIIPNLLAELKNRLKISIFLWRKSCASR